MEKLDVLLVMVDLEYLSKDEPNGQVLDIGICYGTSPDNLQRVRYTPMWQSDSVVQPSTLEFWAEHNPKQLAKYMKNSQPVQWVAKDMEALFLLIKSAAKQMKVGGVVLMSKGITHDLPKLEYLLDTYGPPAYGHSGFGFFEGMFGYNCRRDFRSFKMGRAPELLAAASEYAKRESEKVLPQGALHDAEYDALYQWLEFYAISTGQS